MRVSALPAAGERALAELIERHLAHEAVPVPVHRIAEREGWEIEFRQDLGSILGISGIYRGVKLMWINARLSSAERRAVIAHELGHWINGDEQVIRTCRSSSFAYHWDARLEHDATVAAARLLIPEWTIREYRTVEAIAAACDVPTWLVQVGYRTE
jgi:Zn-dependent peptidase ImmA (M78 family)